MIERRFVYIELDDGNEDGSGEIIAVPATDIAWIGAQPDEARKRNGIWWVPCWWRKSPAWIARQDMHMLTGGTREHLHHTDNPRRQTGADFARQKLSETHNPKARTLADVRAERDAAHNRQ